MLNTNHRLNIGMVIARAEGLGKLEEYSLARGEFVVFKPEQRADLLAFLARRPTRFSIHNPLFVPPDYPENPLLACIIDEDEDRRGKAVALMIENLDLAVELGAEFVVVHVQRPEQFAGIPAGFDRSAAMSAACRSLDSIMEKSRATGIPVLIENIMDNSLFYEAGQYLELIEKYPGLGFCLDIGHLDMDARRFGIDRCGFVEALAPHTLEVHIQNSAGMENSTAHRPWKIPVHPSQNSANGWCDIDSILSAIHAANPHCVFNFEFRPEKEHTHDFILEGMDWVRDIVAR